eukprot:3020690-Heterocapsa_arctica.AAC.1
MSSTRLREPSLFSSLPTMGASDARWIVALYHHQDRCDCMTTDLPAVIYKVAIDLLTDSLYPELTADSALIETEKAR